MIFDFSFVDLELEAAETGILSPQLLSHPAFQAIAYHESELDRPILDAERFLSYLADAAAGEKRDWGLSPLFRDREKLIQLKQTMEQDLDIITQKLARWLGRYTSVPLNSDLHCIFYVGTYDGGFHIIYESQSVFLNIPTLFCREGLFQTLVHESYHARRIGPEVARQIIRLERENDYIGAVLYLTFEEGTAEFIGNDGALTTQYPVIRLRSPAEGTLELRQLLWNYQMGSLTAEEAYQAFQQTDCCYTAGVFIASCVWDAYGMIEFDRWARTCDWKAFYNAFRLTPQGADWPELNL